MSLITNIMGPIITPLMGIKQPVNYVAQLNGGGQYWQLNGGGVSIESLDIIELDFYGGLITGQYARFFASDSNNLSIDSGVSNDTFRVNSAGGEIRLNNVEIQTGDPIPVEGIHSLSMLTGSSAVISQIGAFQGSRLINLPLLNFRVRRNNITIHEIPLTNKAQGAYQVATTTPLGDNLYTQEVIENPLFAMDQWSYLGDGRWQLIGDGSANTVQFLSGFDQPESGYVQFEIESITGSTITCTQNASAGSVFSTAGVKAFYYSSKSEIQSIQFKRSAGSISCVIKNIKHFDAEGVLIAEMIGYNENAWVKESDL